MNYFLILSLCFVTNYLRAEEEDIFAALDSSLPITETETSESIEETQKNSDLVSSDPDILIRDFYRRKRPEYEEKVPEPKDGERIVWKLGETMRDLNIPAGEYSLIRVADRDKGYHIRYLGKLQSDGSHAKVTEAGNEILPNDLIVKENFKVINLPPLTSTGGVLSQDSKAIGKVHAFIEPRQDEKVFFVGNGQLLAAQFKKYSGGNSVSIGSAFVVKRKGEEIAKAIVVDADLDLATLYIYKNFREVRADDELFTH